MLTETKEIFKNWRKFLNEGSDDYGFDRDPEDPDPEGEPVYDEDLIDYINTDKEFVED